MNGTASASPGDELLRWISETGSGSWERLRDGAAHLCQKHELTRRPWTLASELSALGHLDIDWSSREWSVAPPALNLVPGLGLCIVLTGSRPHYVDERFEDATDDLDVYPFEVAQSPAPTAKFAKCASVETAEHVAEALGARLVIDPARGLVEAMRAVDEEPLELAPPPPLEEARRFETTTLLWKPVNEQQPGLYRFDLHGRPVHRRLDDFGNWWTIDLAAGQFLALRGTGTPVVRWQRASGDGSRPDCFDVRQRLSLPVVAERALTVSSGLVPRHVNEWRRYLNVSRELAEMIAQRLLQEIQIVWED